MWFRPSVAQFGKLCSYGAAILDACAQLNERLAALREKLGKDASMGDIAAAAWMERIDLCAHGFYRTPDITGTCPALLHSLAASCYCPPTPVQADLGQYIAQIVASSPVAVSVCPSRHFGKQNKRTPRMRAPQLVSFERITLYNKVKSMTPRT